MIFPCGCSEEQSEFLYDDISVHNCFRSLVHEIYFCPCERTWSIDFHWTDLMGAWTDVFEKVGEKWIGIPRYEEKDIKQSPTVRYGVSKIHFEECDE